MRKYGQHCLVISGFFLFSCLGMQKTPAFISEVGVKTNGASIEKSSLSNLPEGDWQRLDFQDPVANGLRADVLGDAAPEDLRFEVHRDGLVGAKTSLLIRDSQGTLSNTIHPAGYLTFFQTANADEDPQNEIVMYSYPSPAGQSMEVVNGDGSVLYRWETRTEGRFDVIAWEGAPCILTPERDSFAITALDGHPIDRLQAPFAHRFSRIVGRRLAGGMLVVLVSGSGYTNYHMVCVFDAYSKLVYQEVGAGHPSGLLFSEKKPDEFLVSYGKAFFRYVRPGR